MDLLAARVWAGLRRASVYALLIALLVLLTAGALTDNARMKTLPVLGWLCRHKGYATLVCALGSAGSLVIGVFQVWFSKSAKLATEAHFRRLEAMERRLSGQIADVGGKVEAADTRNVDEHHRTQAEMAGIKAIVAGLQSQRAKEDGESLPAASPEALAAAQTAAATIVRSPSVTAQRAGELIAEGRVTEGFSALRQAATAAETDAAENWRTLGALAFLVSVAEARDAYERAAALDPSDVWTHIFLARLHRATGSTAKAEAAARRAITVAIDPHDRKCALDEFGDVAVAEGDLAAARKAYENGFAIAKDLLTRDPGNTEWKRDLAISYQVLGDVAVAGGDLLAARESYENGFAIAKELSVRDPGDTELKRDLSVSYNKLGDVAWAAGDQLAARKSYESCLALAKGLTTRDVGNTQWQRDLALSYDRVGDVAVAEGDLPAARKAYEASLDIRKDLTARDPANTEWKRDLAISHGKLGQFAEASGDLTYACCSFREAERRFREVLAISPGHAETRRMAELAARDAARVCG
jgi:tetratricopeptide (TPR) repeat protein